MLKYAMIGSMRGYSTRKTKKYTKHERKFWWAVLALFGLLLASQVSSFSLWLNS